MTKVLKLFILTSLISFLTGCPEPPPERPPAERDPDPVETPRPERDAIFRSARAKYGSSGACTESRECEEICNDIYEHRLDKTRCVQELPIRQVELLEEIYDTLSKRINRKALNKIDSDDLRVLVHISVDPIVTWVSQMSTSEVREVLTWIAENKEPSTVFITKDTGFHVLKALLEKLDRNKPLALSAPISKGDSFIEIALDKDNYEAVDWIHEFFDEECSSVNNYIECVFREHYCHLTLNSRAENSYFGYDPIL